MTATLSSPMPNVSGLREGRRRLFVSVVQSVLLYGVSTWAPSLARERRSVAALVQRRAAIRSMCTYQMVSDDAVMVVAGMPPIDLMALRALQRVRGQEGAFTGSNRVWTSGDSGNVPTAGA